MLPNNASVIPHIRFYSNLQKKMKSLLRIRSSLVYTDFDSDFGGPFDPDSFDEIEQPPPVHIIYPRPASSSPYHSIALQEKFSASFYIILYAIQFCTVFR